MEDENRMKMIGENRHELVDLTSNVEGLLEALKTGDILNEEELQSIVGMESPFEQKTHLYSLISEKEGEGVFDKLLGALRGTGNGDAADKLEEWGLVGGGFRGAPDHEGIALADQIEKEFERIQSEVEMSEEVTTTTTTTSPAETHEEVPQSSQVFEEEEEEGVEEDQSTGVRVEITAPTESETEVEPEPELVQVTTQEDKEEERAEVDAEDVATSVVEVVEKLGVAQVEEEEEEVVVVQPEVLVEEAPKASKQVSFVPSSEEPKEFTLHDEEDVGGRGDRRRSSGSPDTKSIVALNREKFEKPSVNGEGGPKVRFSIKKGSTPNSQLLKEEEPKESTVKNLTSFFQKLGSTDKKNEGAEVAKRVGVRGNPANRRTMI